jgi:hypothetical protein
MDFLKKHYEKIILGIVLLGLLVAVGFIPVKVGAEKKELEETRQKLIPRNVKPLTNIDLTASEAAIKRVATPVTLDLANNHRLFNAMPWQKASDGHLIKYDDSHIGPKAVTITKLTELYLIIRLDKITVADSNVVKYTIGVEKQAAPSQSQRAKKEYYCKVGDKNDMFVLRKIDGPPEKPTKLYLELNDSGEPVTITEEQPFMRVDGYMADLKYAPENKSWTNRRVGSAALTFNNEEYNIVAISKSEVVLSAKSNQKKWPILASSTTNNPNATTP